MARRRKSKETPIETLFKAPWWVSVGIAVVVLVGLKWILPSMWASNMFLKPLANMLSGFAWLFSGVFFFVGILSFARQKLSEKSGSAFLQPSPSWSPSEPTIKREISTVDTAWNVPVDGPQQSAEDRMWVELQGMKTATKAKPMEWSIGLLRDLEWRRFEDVCQKFYEMKGIKSETTPLGPDGGIDIRLFQDDSGRPTSIVQCKAWGERYVGVKPVRELLGVIAHEKIEKAIFMASGNFTDDAKLFAQTNSITLINGEMLVAMIKRLPGAEPRALLDFATEGDYTIPTCPTCGIKMQRIAGKNSRPDFWGCRNFPRCRQKLGVRQ